MPVFVTDYKEMEINCALVLKAIDFNARLKSYPFCCNIRDKYN